MIVCLLVLFVSVNFAQKQSVKRTKKKHKVAQKKKADFFNCQYDPGVTNMELSQSEIALNCPPSIENCPNNKIIEVKVTTIDTGDRVYAYAISAGKIIGEGANVQWDLTDVKPGTYTITASVSQYGRTQTRVVVIKE